MGEGELCRVVDVEARTVEISEFCGCVGAGVAEFCRGRVVTGGTGKRGTFTAECQIKLQPI
jgi:hypothetical protein